ncbi:hypothetical protein CDAR_596641 [Caerostris darwini]|uniref:Uncharacterized protein n=1 Tax=Caerostris darwini TaxID=1538125 RepID=A0AAV4WEF7_9ARAC|nr:hypothetical protein CDAR_596641 [Caerostris darwini]
MTLAFHRREWGFEKERIPPALSDNKGDEWSEPFVSFNAPESDGAPRACQKRANVKDINDGLSPEAKTLLYLLVTSRS